MLKFPNIKTRSSLRPGTSSSEQYMRGLDLLKVSQKISNQREFCACSVCFPTYFKQWCCDIIWTFFLQPSTSWIFHFVFGDNHTNEKMLLNNILELKLAASAVTGREECCVWRQYIGGAALACSQACSVKSACALQQANKSLHTPSSLACVSEKEKKRKKGDMSCQRPRSTTATQLTQSRLVAMVIL